MKIFLAIIFFSSFAQAECMNWISPEEAAKAIAGLPGAGGNSCKDPVTCLCYDGVDWEVVVLTNGQITLDPVKKATKDAKVAAAAAEKVRLDAITAQRKIRMRELGIKWKNGTITASEKDELLKHVSFDYIKGID